MTKNQPSTNNEKSSYAKALKRFVHPTVQTTDDRTALNTKYAFGVHVWNAEAMRKGYPDRFEKAREQVIQKSIDPVEAEQLFNRMLEFKEKEFSSFDRVIIDFEVLGDSGEDYTLTVASAQLKK